MRRRLPKDVSAQPDNFYSPANYDFYSRDPYKPLEKAEKGIRLLRLLKDDGSGQLRCTLGDEIALAEARDSYTAVSYCAGDPKNTRPVQVNGLEFNAFANLALALVETRHYRTTAHDDHEPLLWVDQICINQSNPAERSHQVGFMQDIYRCAREVAICLSTEEVGGGAMDWIQHVSECLPGLEKVLQAASNNRDFLESKRSMLNLAFKDDADRENAFLLKTMFRDLCWSNLNNETFVEGWLDVLNMLGQPWWTRAWIFQEYMVAKDARFIYGRRTTHWRPFSAVLLSLIGLGHITNDKTFLKLNKHCLTNGPEHQLINRLSNTRDLLGNSVTAAEFILKCKSSPAERSRSDLKTLLFHSRFCGASDPRDHIYAFLGLASPNLDITPDYSSRNTVQDLFSDTARRLITHDRNLGVLSHAVASRGHLHSTLPSWVPDWTSKEQAVDQRQTIQSLARNGLYYNIKITETTDAQFLDGGRTLGVSGLFIDTLTASDEGGRSTPHQKKIFRSFETPQGYSVRTIGAGMADDQLWILDGASTPFILRPDEDSFTLVCESVILNMGEELKYKIMKGRFVGEWTDVGIRRQIRIR